MSETQPTQDDLDEAIGQKEIFEIILVKYEEEVAADPSNTFVKDLIPQIEEKISEIKDEIEEIDDYLFPSVKPTRCSTCNDHPMVNSPLKTCVLCDGAIDDCQPVDGETNWRFPVDWSNDQKAEWRTEHV